MNKNISRIHLEILDNNRQQLLEKLLPFTEDFVLSGGTALALQLNHRKSFDFDFFSLSPISEKLLEQISKVINIASIAVNTPDELTIFAEGEIKVTFLYYPFKMLLSILELENGLKIFNLKDIALQKAYTIGRRGEYRDYFDLYTIFKEKQMTLSEVISSAKKVYGNIFEEKLFLTQLVYFGDLLSFEIIPALEKQLPKPEEVKDYLEKEVEEYLENLK